MTRYAEDTSVTTDRSRAEIERTLTRYGASAFMYGWDGDAAALGFRLGGRQVRFRLTMPDRASLRHGGLWLSWSRRSWKPEEFLAHLLLPNGETVGEWVGPQIEEVYVTGQMPKMAAWLRSNVKALPSGQRRQGKGTMTWQSREQRN